MPEPTVTSHLDRGQEIPLDMLAGELSGEDGAAADVSLTDVGGGPALRRRYAEDGVTKVDYLLLVPGRPAGFLVMAFGTPMEPLADALVTLFDAIALSQRWQP